MQRVTTLCPSGWRRTASITNAVARSAASAKPPWTEPVASSVSVSSRVLFPSSTSLQSSGCLWKLTINVAQKKPYITFFANNNNDSKENNEKRQGKGKYCERLMRRLDGAATSDIVPPLPHVPPTEYIHEKTRLCTQIRRLVWKT
uniref:Uncharacterized protein n=1 Tax=Trypanosoma congolense (strain IL3000) TaxID=1068625 RepID=G0UPG8_TRYCI|nr:hypothetical protein, unlikely [Trypanosoma congolense IL3000]